MHRGKLAGLKINIAAGAAFDKYGRLSDKPERIINIALCSQP
jgi:hypothetical protein